MSIRITTTQAIETGLARERLAVTARHVAAIQKLLPADCTHQHRPQCPKCSARSTVQAAVDAVLDTGGQS